MLDRALLSLPGARPLLACIGALCVARALAAAGQAWGLASVVANVWGGAPVDAQLGWAALFAGCYAARLAVAYAQDALLDRFAARQAARIRDEVLAALAAEGALLVQRHGTGAVSMLAVEGIDRVRSYIHLTMPKAIALAVVPLALLAWIYPLDWVSGIIVTVAFPCIMLFMVLLGHAAKAEAGKQHATFERLSNAFVDALRGLDTLKRFGRSRAHAEEVYAASERFREATMRTLRVAMLSSAVLDLVATGALAAVAIMLGFRLIDGSVALFPAFAVLMLVPEFFRPVREFAADYHASLDGKNALASALAIAEDGRRASAWHAAGALPACDAGCSFEAQGVAFAHGGRAVLEGASFRVACPAKVGIVGASGAGKTTLANLLAGLADPAEGTFSVGGAPAATLRCPSWLSRVAYIPQSPYLFHMSVRDNVAFYCPDADDARVERAVEAVGLGEAVASLPQGLATVVGEGGHGLSGGQAQRIALARALLDERRRVLVFDEPTAHLDIETEYELKERMLPLMEGRLVFFATHRLHWVADMDYVIVLEGGRIVQAGTPAEVTSCDGPYARLAAQMRGDAR